MAEPLLKVKNLNQHFKISRSFTVKAVNGVIFENLQKSRVFNFSRKAANL